MNLNPVSILRRKLRRMAILIVVTAVAVLALAVSAQSLLHNLTNPFAATIADHSPPPVLTSLRKLGDFHAATATYQTVIDVEHGTAHIPAVVLGQRTTFLAVGTVDAIVDFTRLDSGNVQVSADRRSVTVLVPMPRLAPAVVDPHASRVLARDRGLIDRVASAFTADLGDTTELYVTAGQHLDAVAAASDLTNQAQVSTRQALTQLLTAAGFSTISIDFVNSTKP